MLVYSDTMQLAIASYKVDICSYMLFPILLNMCHNVSKTNQQNTTHLLAMAVARCS